MPAKKEPRSLPSPWKEFLSELDGILHEPLELHCIGGFVFAYFYGRDYQLPEMRLKNKHPLAFSRALESAMHLRLLSCPDSGVLDASTVFPASQGAEGKVPLDQAQQILFRKNNGEWIELLRLQSDEQVAGDPVLAGHWFVVSTISQARTRILLYQVAKANLPVVRLSVEIEGPAKASVRLDSCNLVIADDYLWGTYSGYSPVVLIGSYWDAATFHNRCELGLNLISIG
jgi:hypothetical protein